MCIYFILILHLRILFSYPTGAPWGQNQFINFLLVGEAVFPPCCLAWGQTMLGVMAGMVASFRRACARTVVFSAPDPEAGHCRPLPLPETPGRSQASLAQSLVGTLLLSPGSWCTQGFVCALQESALVIPKHPLPTTQETTRHMDITKWSIPKSDWLYSLQPKMEKLYTVSKKKDWELTVAQTMNSLLPNLDLNWRK